jgi:hypothetical protein
LMTKMSEEDLELQIISQQPEWSHSSAPCQWDWTKDGTKFSLICRISLEEPMVATTFRL